LKFRILPKHFRDRARVGAIERDHNYRRGDSVTAVKQAGVADKMTFISTGGGATLKLLEARHCRGWRADGQ